MIICETTNKVTTKKPLYNKICETTNIFEQSNHFTVWYVKPTNKFEPPTTIEYINPFE